MEPILSGIEVVFAMLSYFNGLCARRRAEALCQQTNPAEPLLGSWICANEPGRFVVRVFYGQREWTSEVATMMPPWRDCLIVAVDKASLHAVPVEGEDAAPYQPVLR